MFVFEPISFMCFKKKKKKKNKKKKKKKLQVKKKKKKKKKTIKINQKNFGENNGQN